MSPAPKAGHGVVAIEDTDENFTALSDLVASEGWRVLCHYAEVEWDAERLLTRIASARGTEAALAAASAQVLAEREAVTRLMRAPRLAMREMEERRHPREAAPIVPPRA